jgi:HlyD family secretion protein
MSTPAPVAPAAPEPGAPPPLPRRRRRRWVVIAIVVALAIAALYARYRTAEGDSAARWLTVAVDRGTIEETVTAAPPGTSGPRAPATGTVNPVKTVQVGTYVSGPIIAIDVDYNSPVKQGQRVAKIDPAPFAVKVRQAEANLANARARVEKSRADLALKKLLVERTRTLVGEKIVSQTDYDTAKSNYDQAVAQLALDEAAAKQAQASLEAEQVNLRYTDILSPVDGVVVSRNVDVGQTVAASFQTPTLFLIAEDLTKMQVDTNVSESDVGRLRQGEPATFTVDAYPGTAFHGTVAQVRNAPITVQNVVTYDVVIAVDNSGLELKPGMTANVSITTARRDDVLRLPMRALRFRPDAAVEPKSRREGSRVYVLDGGNALRPVEVETGIQDAQHVELVRGDVREGDRVATGVRRDTATAPPPQLPGFAGGRRFH